MFWPANVEAKDILVSIVDFLMVQAIKDILVSMVDFLLPEGKDILVSIVNLLAIEAAIIFISNYVLYFMDRGQISSDRSGVFWSFCSF